MPRTDSKATVNNFIGGLVSDYHELNTPPNTTVDELNCDLDRKGSRKRRLGLDFEDGFQGSTGSVSEGDWFGTYTKAFEWDAVAEDGNLNYIVIQGGSFLSFFDQNFDTLSQGEKSFTVNLNDFKAPAYADTASFPVQVASGKGALFVVGEAINPFYIQYDPATDTITTTQLNLKIRDLQLQDHTMGLTDQLLTLTPAQKYDLYNQGWGAHSNCQQASNTILHDKIVLDFYRGFANKYPQKAKSWWLGKIVTVNFGVEAFNANSYDTVYCGTTLAPLGTFILDAFNLDRSAVSGIPGLPVVTETSRPTAVAFGSGRVFYGFKNKVMFSQLIVDDFTVAEQCYQQADPTSEKISDLVATDGGVLQIIDSSNIFKMVAWENSIFIFSGNGLWALGGSNIGAGFSATDFSVYKVTSASALSSRSVIDYEGAPVYWSKLGIYIIVSDPAKQGYSVENILEEKLQLFYNAIPPLSKLRASGAYDETKKVLSWVYNSTGETIGGNPFVADRILNYDTIAKAFYPYSISETNDGNSPYVTDVFNVSDIVAESTPENVTDNNLVPVFDNAAENVQVEILTPGNAANTTTSLKFLTFYKAT